MAWTCTGLGESDMGVHYVSLFIVDMQSVSVHCVGKHSMDLLDMGTHKT
jgi:hypothetical protein